MKSPVRKLETPRVPSGNPGWTAALALGAALCLACSPGDPMVEARELLENGEAGEAVQRLREAVTADPADPELLHHYGRALIANDQAGLAAWPLQRSASDPEWAVESGLLLTQALLLTENQHEAVRTVDAVLAVDPDNLNAVRLRADARLGAQRPLDALEDLDRLIEAFPNELMHSEKKLNILLDEERFDEAEALLDELAAAVESRDDLHPTAPALLCARKAGLEIRRGNTEEAERRVEGCLEEHLASQIVVSQAVAFFDDRDERERSDEILRSATASMPDNVGLLTLLARRLDKRGKRDDATELLREAAERLDTPLAWMALRNHQVEHDDMSGALASTDRLLQALTGHAPGEPGFSYESVPEDRLFEAAEVVAISGDTARAAEMGEHLEEEAYRHLLDARIHFERDELPEALEAWDRAFRLYPSNPGGRHLAGIAALRNGEVERGIEHLRNSVRTRTPGSDVALVLGRVYLALGQPGAALDAVQYHFAGNPGDVTALEFQARLAGLVGNEASERSALSQLFALQPAKAVASRARTLASLLGDAETLTYLEEVEIDLDDPANLEALAVWAERMVLLDRADEGLARLARLRGEHPDDVGLLALQGATLGAAGEADAARAALERALALEPNHHQALVALARLDARAGNVDSAVERFRLAAEIEPADPTPITEAADALFAAGRDDEARELLEERLREHPWEGRAAHLLARSALESGDHGDVALAWAQRAALFHAEVGGRAFETLGRMHLARGESQEAVTPLRRAAALGVGSPSGLYRIGLALAEAGDVEGAIRALEAALSNDEFPEAEQARASLESLRGTG